jgi:serine/threonine protein kinase/tetratricopeptide (TPR) repeat protein
MTNLGRMGRYHVLRLLGQGGMGAVYEAFDPELGRKLAIKILHASAFTTVDDDKTRRNRTRLLREARSLAKLAHPNIVAIYDVGVLEDQSIFIAMEFVAGQTLNHVLGEKSVTWDEALKIVMKSAVGLAAAHQAGLLHRDFKPENILVAHDGRVIVLDFGLSKAAQTSDEDPFEDNDLEHEKPDEVPPAGGYGVGIADKENSDTARQGHSRYSIGHVTLSGQGEITQAGGVLGTPAYMAPEQMKRASLSAATDIFALACVIFEAVTGTAPFPTEPWGDRLQAISTPQLQWPMQVPKWLRTAVTRGLAYAPEDRWPSVEAFIATLQAGLDRRTKRRRLSHVALLLLTIPVISLALWNGTREPTKDPECRDPSPQVNEVWNDAIRQRLQVAFSVSKVSIAEEIALRTARTLDAWKEAWIRAAGHRCADTRRELGLEAMDLALREQSRACLAQCQAQVTALLQTWRNPGTQQILAAVGATNSLTNPEQCADIEELRRRKPLPQNASERHYVLSQLANIQGAKVLIEQGEYASAEQALEAIERKRGEMFDLQVEAHFASAVGELRFWETQRGVSSAPQLRRAQLWSIAADVPEMNANSTEKAWFAEVYRGNRREESVEILRSHAAAVGRQGQAAALRVGLERNRGIWQSMNRNMNNALLHFERSLDYSRQAFGSQSVRVSLQLDALGFSAYLLNRLQLAYDYYVEDLSILLAHQPPGHPDRSRAFEQIGLILLDAGRLKDARQYLFRGWSECSDSGMSAISCGMNQASVANCDVASGELDNSAASWLMMVEIENAEHRRIDPQSPWNEMPLAGTFAKRGEIQSALLLAEVARTKLQREGEVHPEVRARALLAGISIAIAGSDPARAALAITELERTLSIPTEDARRYLALTKLAKAQLALETRDMHRAIDLLEELLANAGDETRLTPFDITNIHLYFAQALLGIHAIEFAREHATHAFDLHQSIPDLKPHLNIPYREALACIALAQGRYDRALFHVEQAQLEFDPVQVLDNRRASLFFLEAQILWALDGNSRDRENARALAKRAITEYEDWDAGADAKIVEVKQWLRVHAAK